jgi:hypothetical protein
MALRNQGGQPKNPSRRTFLGQLTLGLAAVGGAGSLLRHLLTSGNEERDMAARQLPGPDSIFHPRQDPQLEAQEKSRRA